jgi:hypothetical protein
MSETKYIVENKDTVNTPDGQTTVDRAKKFASKNKTYLIGFVVASLLIVIFIYIGVTKKESFGGNISSFLNKQPRSDSHADPSEDFSMATEFKKLKHIQQKTLSRLSKT